MQMTRNGMGAPLPDLPVVIGMVDEVAASAIAEGDGLWTGLYERKEATYQAPHESSETAVPLKSVHSLRSTVKEIDQPQQGAKALSFPTYTAVSGRELTFLVHWFEDGRLYGIQLSKEIRIVFLFGVLC